MVEVPPYHPRTKPKALTYALAGVRGEFVTIYDAEDRPHPKQLLEAYGRFQSAGPELVCLQSPLIISNMRASFISSLFAVEYAALFRGLLPMLGRYRLPCRWAAPPIISAAYVSEAPEGLGALKFLVEFDKLLPLMLFFM